MMQGRESFQYYTDYNPIRKHKKECGEYERISKAYKTSTELKANPYHILQPFVPVSKINQKLLYPEIGYDVTEKDFQQKKKVQNSQF